MNWIPSFFRPSYAWLFALLIPVIIFYFLKMRRTRLEISSLALWRQVINDQRVNAPFQKFKRNILLYLQLLLLTLLALAAMQPFIPGASARQQYLPIIIDCSASMGAVDANGISRLDLAKEQISEIVEGMMPGQQLTLISVGATTRRLTEFTDNKPLLRKALDDLRVDDVPSRVADGLRLAQALSRTHNIERVRLYSDGNLPTKPNPATGFPMAEIDFDLTFPVDFFQIDPVRNNIGITAFNARRSSADEWDVFVRVESAVDAGSEAEVIMSANGEVMGSDEVILNAGESQRLVFSVDATTDQNLEVKLRPRGTDALAADNTAWLNLPKGRRLTVYCPKNLRTFRHAFQALEGALVEPNEDDEAFQSEYDLVVSDKQEDLDRPSAVSLFIGMVPEKLREQITVEEENSEVVDWMRDAQILQHVMLKDVVISQLPKKKQGVEDDEIEQAGFEIVAHGSQGPLILKQHDGISVKYYFLFHTDKSTLPYRVGFPVICSNLTAEAMQLASLSEIRAPSTGVLPELSFEKNESLRVTNPLGKHDERTTNDDGILSGVPAPNVGQYEVRSGGELKTKIGVGLLDPAETSLLAVDKLYFNELSVDAEIEQLDTDKPLWPMLAAVGFFVLLFEWWYFQKKPAGIPD